jgi:hypothetical protein
MQMNITSSLEKRFIGPAFGFNYKEFILSIEHSLLDTKNLMGKKNLQIQG